MNKSHIERQSPHIISASMKRVSDEFKEKKTVTDKEEITKVSTLRHCSNFVVYICYMIILKYQINNTCSFYCLLLQLIDLSESVTIYLKSAVVQGKLNTNTGHYGKANSFPRFIGLVDRVVMPL